MVSKWKIVLAALAAVFILPLILIWSAFSWFLGQTPLYATALSFFIQLGATILCIQHDNLSVYDYPAVMLLVLCILSFTKPIAMHISLVIAFLSYVIARRIYGFESTLALDVLTAWSCVGIIWTFISVHSLWIPTTYESLVRTEKAVYDANLKVPYKMSTVAGMGTVHVPFSGTREAGNPPLNVVLIHGYAGGNGLWAASLGHLSQHFNVYAVEWLGAGRSDRPSTKHFKTYVEADDFFVQSIEHWRIAVGLETMVLCGHSMGGMFITHYSLQYPQRVEQLVLISPCGLPSPESEPHWLLAFLWNLGITPMDLIRTAGPLGPRLMRWILTARLSRQPETNAIKRGILEMGLMVQYNYHNWAGKKSGEIAMHSHLLPRAFAKRPLKHALVPSKMKMPISFIYGEDGNDWMNSSHAAKLLPDLKQHTVLHKVPSAGHQVFMDNPEVFNEYLVQSIQTAAMAGFCEKR